MVPTLVSADSTMQYAKNIVCVGLRDIHKLAFSKHLECLEFLRYKYALLQPINIANQTRKYTYDCYKKTRQKGLLHLPLVLGFGFPLS